MRASPRACSAAFKATASLRFSSTSSTSVPNKPQPLTYATSLVRNSDNDSFWASFFYPPAARDAYLAIRALNVELASINDQVSTPMAAKLRFQWWKDGLKSAFEDRPLPHPLLQLIAALPQKHSLSPYHFTRLITAREAHFLNPSFTTLQDLAEYSAGTQASILYLLLQVASSSSSPPLQRSDKSGSPLVPLPHSKPFQHVGGEHDGDVTAGVDAPLKPADALTLDHAAAHLAVATTISILVRSIPFHASKRINVIPTEIASRHSLSDEALFRQGPEAEGLRNCVASLVGIAEAELRTARACFDGTTGIPKHAVPVFLAATPARNIIERLSCEQVDFNPFDAQVQKRPWKLPFQVWWDARSSKF